MNNNLIKKYPILIPIFIDNHCIIHGITVEGNNVHFEYRIELEVNFSLFDYNLLNIKNAKFDDSFMFCGYLIVHKSIIHLIKDDFEDDTITRKTILDIFTNSKQIFNLNLDSNALITSSKSIHKNRFVYIVKEDDQYFIFIKKSIDNNSDIIETIILESEQKTIEFINNLDLLWIN